jgi:diguanylate cyclase (GGDEF)-like protein
MGSQHEPVGTRRGDRHGGGVDAPEPPTATSTATSNETSTETSTETSIEASTPSPIDVDEVLERRIHDRALDHVVRNIAPLRIVLLPLALLVGFLMNGMVDDDRLAVWLGVAMLATLSVFASVHIQITRAEVDGGEPVRSTWLTGSALAVVGALAGLSSWVAATSSIEMSLLFTLFPAVSCATGAIVCAGRLDMYVAFVVPLTVLTSLGLWSTGDGRLQALAALMGAFALSQALLHHTVSDSLRSSLRLQLVSQALAVKMARDQIALESAYEEAAEANAQLVHMATHDPLTGLLNRRGTLDAIDGVLAERDGPHSILYCDLDRFKAINDLLGHRGGDQFLTVLADRIARSLHDGCLPGRIGGDEFVVVLPGHDTSEAVAVAARLVTVLAQPVHAEGRSVPSSVSVGLATHPEHGATSTELLRHANAALYRAKRGGRNRVEVFDGAIRAELDAAHAAETSLRRAIEDNEIVPYFQPEIDATTGRVVGAELLARWVQADGSVASAADFIAVASQAGLLDRLTERVFVQARPDIRRLASIGLPDGFRFRVNLAPSSTDRSWRDDPIAELVRGIDPSLLTVDVRESSVADDLPSAAATLASFRARGGRVCLDDFTRGVSSLSMLRLLPVDEVRIDRHSIDTITAHPHDRAVVRSVIALVRELGLSVTAEAVETGAQADTLIALGCVRHQGHHYSPALSAHRFEDFLLSNEAAGLAEASRDDPWASGSF